MSTPLATHRPSGGPGPAPTGPASGGSSSSLAALAKKPGPIIAMVGAGLVVLVALMKRSSASTDSSTTADGTSTYDSTSTDLYNSIQPEIDALTKELEDLQTSLGNPAPPPSSTSTAPPFSQPAGLNGQPALGAHLPVSPVRIFGSPK